MRPIPAIPIAEQPEGVILRCLIWGEARGEPVLGQLAVLWVVMNRAKKSGRTPKQEALRPWQFSTFNENDPNRPKLIRADLIDETAWTKADTICELFAHGVTVDPTQGATHYYALEKADPPWGRRHPDWKERVVIARHVFGNAA